VTYSEYSLDGGTFVNAGNGTSISILIESEGDHVILVRAHDEAGNTITVTHEFNVDFGGGSLRTLGLYAAIGVAAVVIGVAGFMLLRRKGKIPEP
jgi:hypothetical protein